MTSLMTFFFSMVLPESFGKSLAALGIVASVSVNLFAVHEGHAQEFRTATASKAATISAMELVQRLHNHDLPRDQGTDSVVIRTLTLVESFKNFIYTYTFFTNDEVPETSSDIFSSGLYA